MTDNINLSNLNRNELREFNFHEHQNMRLTDQQFNELIKKEGEITLDSQGNFKVINPPAHRDNMFVSFIKRIFVRGYAQQQKELDKMEILRQNIYFTDMLKDHVKKYAESQIGKSPIVHSAKVIRDSIDDHFSNNTSLKMEKLRDLIQTAKSANETLKEYANTIFKDGYGPNSIVLNGEGMSLSSFISKYAKGKEFSEIKFVEAIIQGAVNNPAQLEILSNEDWGIARKLKNLLSMPSLKAFERDQLNELTGRLIHTVKSKLNEYIQKSFENGFTPESIAAKVINGIDSIIKDKDGEGSSLIGGLLRSGGYGELHADNISNLQKTDKPQDRYLKNDSDKVLKQNTEKLVTGLPNNFPVDKIPKIIGFTNNDPEKVDNYIKIVNTLNANRSIQGHIRTLMRQAGEGHYLAVLEAAEKIMNKCRELSGNEKLTSEQISEYMRVMVNYTMLNSTENDEKETGNVKFGNITRIMLPVFENVLKEHSDSLDADGQNIIVNEQEEVSLKERADQKEALLTALSTLKEIKTQFIISRAGSTISKITEQTQKLSQEEYKNNLNLILKLKQTENIPEINNAVADFPEEKRKAVSTLLKGLVIGYIRKNGLKDDYDEPISLQRIANNIVKTMKKDRELMSIINLNNISDEVLKNHADLFSNHPVFGLKANFYSQVDNKNNNNKFDETQNGWHKDLDTDVSRNFITRINDTDITEIKDDEEKVKKVHELLGSIDKKFIPYVTTHLMQGGGARYTAVTFAPMGLPELIPNFSRTAYLSKGIDLSLSNGTVVDIKDNKIVISINVKPMLKLHDSFHDLGGTTEEVHLFGFKYETTIDMTKGVDEKGYPLGLENKFYFEKNNA